MTLNNDSHYLTLVDVLKKINDDVTLLGTDFKFNTNSALHRIFTYAFDEKMALPEGEPPYKHPNIKEGASIIDLLILIRRGRLDYFSEKKYPTLSKSKREEIFIRTLECLSDGEAETLILVKDQQLFKKFPNITRDVLVEYGYLPKLEEDKSDTKSVDVGTEVSTKSVAVTKKTSNTKKANKVSKSKAKKTKK
jgi:hypothetical protein